MHMRQCLKYPVHNLSDISELHTDISFRMQLDRLPDLPSADLYHAVAQIAVNKDYRRRAMELRNEDAIAIADAAQKVCIPRGTYPPKQHYYIWKSSVSRIPL